MANQIDKPEITEKSEKKDPILIGFFILGIVICLVLLFYPDLISKSPQKPISKSNLNFNAKKIANRNRNENRNENRNSNLRVTDKNQSKDILLDTLQFRNYVHIQDLYDLYEFKENNLVYRSVPKTLLATEIPINWQSKTKKIEKVYGQLSNQPDFQNIQSEFLVFGQKTEGVFKNSILGKNYFRLSQDGKIWTATAEIHVVTLPLQSSSLPKIKSEANILYLQNEYVDFVGTIESDLNHFIVEISLDSKFTKKNTKILWLAKNDFQFRQFQLGHFFMRVRGVDSKMKITALSDAIQVQILKPKPVPAITLSKVKHKIKVKPQQIFEETPLDSDAKILDSTMLTEPVVQQQLRQPSTVATLIEKIPEGSKFLNNNYLSSKLALEGSAFTMFSVDQIDQGKTNPTASSMALRWTHTNVNQSYMGYIKSQVANWQSSPDGNVSTLQLEAQYRYGWVFPVNPFSKNSQSGISVIAGYEYYKNSSQNANSVFSPGYSVFKTGLAFQAPILSRLDTGIEFLLGQGLDSSKKYEVSGNLNYYIDTRWSLGLGYRIHLFDAGSAATASPVGLPYREGFAEGFSVLRWHY